MLSAECGSGACTVVFDLEQKMKNTDWGKLIARLLAVMLTLEVVQYVSSNWSTYSDPAPGVGLSTLDLVYPSLTMVVAICAWVFAERFAPGGDRGEIVEVSFAGAAVLAAVAGYVFVTFTQSFLEGIIKRSATEPPVAPPSVLSILFDIAVCLAAGLVIANSRRVTEWVAR